MESALRALARAAVGLLVLVCVGCAARGVPGAAGGAASPVRSEPILVSGDASAAWAEAASAIAGTAGCLAGTPTPGATLELAVHGTPRRVHLVAPRRGEGPHPLVVGFHGRTNDAERFARYSDLDDAFPGAWLAFPEALPAGSGFRWSDPDDAPDRLRDYALFDALLSELGRRACLDPARVYLAGHSLGSSFAASLACARGARVRAALLVAGGIVGRDCRAPVAALVVHHPDDALVPFATGERVRDRFAALNGVAPPGEPWRGGALAALNCERWGAAGDPDPVGWCPHDRGATRSGRVYPHRWPDEAPAAFRAFVDGLGVQPK